MVTRETYNRPYEEENTMNKKNIPIDTLLANVETADNLMMMVDMSSGRTTFISEGAREFLGIDKDSRQLPDPMNILPGWTEMVSRLNRIDGEVKNIRHRTEFIHANGDRTDIQINLYGIKTTEGKYAMVTISNMSEQVRQNWVLEKAFFSSPYAVALLDKKGMIAGVNDNFTKLFKYTEDEIKEFRIKALAPKGLYGVIEKNLKDSYEGKTVKQEGLRRTKDGKLINVEILGCPIIHRNKVEGLYILYVDITDKKNHEKYLSIFREILEKNNEGVIIANKDGNIAWTNNAFRSYTGFSKEEIVGKSYEIFSPADNPDKGWIVWDSLKQNGSWNGEIRFQDKAGITKSYWLDIYSVEESGQDEKSYVGILNNISRDAGRLKVSVGEERDSLTGVLNRTSFIQIIENMTERYSKTNDKFALLAIDINNFKDINDSLGHLTGDNMLISLSVRISDVLAKKAIISRFDGDEFLVFMPYENEREVFNQAAEIREAAAVPYRSSNSTVYLKVNIGVSLYPKHAMDTETLIRYSNIAMYKSREQGNSRISFYSMHMSNGIEENFFIANFLVEAIDKEELSMSYQPIIDIESGKLKGIEALMRWNNEVLGDVPPNKFIAVAEKTGQIIQIGEWGFIEVCRQIREWNDKGIHNMEVSVNVSIKQLEQPGFCNRVRGITDHFGVDPRYIEMEITESVSSGDLTQIVENLQSLKRQGFSIAMDDFGTGFSSLGQLDIFELDKLKIDKIFIDEIVTDKRKQNLVKAIIAMAKSLNLKVVAEGIETQHQLDFLREMGCNLGQGYLFSKPLKKEVIEEFYRSSPVYQ